MTFSATDWTDDASTAISLCRDWAQSVRLEIPCEIYLFGSAIYEGGDQFDRELSDLDIVIIFLEELEATERVSRLVRLENLKRELELDMIPFLQRPNPNEPGVSIVPLSQFELSANIHKSGSRSFFTKNTYYNLLTDDISLGLEGSGAVTVEENARQALEYCQKIRNQFLAVSANRKGGLPPYSSLDPLPKATVRCAAQLIPNTEDGKWYDTRLGLEYLHRALGDLRAETDELGDVAPGI